MRICRARWKWRGQGRQLARLFANPVPPRYSRQQKDISVYIEAAATADTVEVYEAPIDAMSGASLKIIQHTGNWRGVHYLALGGTDYAALDAFLTYYPNITHIVLCLDNDEAGRTRTQDIIKHLDGSGKTVEDRQPPIGKDYNDTLVQVTQEYQKHCISLDDILEEETR